MALITRWTATLASFYIMVVSCGSLNTFSLFSQYMRDSLGYDQESINTVSFVKEMGTSLGIIAGFIYNATGAGFVLVLSSALNVLGYLLTWLCITGKIPAPPVWQLCLYICLVGASAAFTITAVLVPCAHNFSKNQGTILSLMDSTNGLAGAIFTLIFQAYFSSSPSSFVLMLGWFPSALMLILLPFVRQLPPSSSSHPANDLRNMHWLLFLTVALALYLMLVILLQHVFDLPTRIVQLFSAVMLLILVVPIPVILVSERTASSKTEDSSSSSLLIEEEADAESVAEEAIPIESADKLGYGEDYTIWQAVCSIDLWLIVIATTCGVGAALTVNNNLGQIGLSLGYSPLHTNTFVALLSIWDYLGGVATGSLSDILLQRCGVPRPFFFSLSLAILAAGNLVIGLNLLPGSLFLGSVLIGISLGGQWAVLFTIIAEIFGLKNYATLQNIPTMAKGVGMYFLSVKLAGLLYDREAKQDSDDGACFGTHCYRNTFLVMASACMLGCLMTALLAKRTCNFYRSVVRHK